MPDLSATLLDIAGVAAPPQFDGSSILPALRGEAPAAGAERRMVLVEYVGETADGGGSDPACAQTGKTDLFCGADGNYSIPPFFYGAPLCVCQDSANNTYSCLRVRTGAANYRYCEFLDDAKFVEYFDEANDPYELENQAAALAPSVRAALSARLAAVHACVGAAQCDPLLAQPIAVRGADGREVVVDDPLHFERREAAATAAAAAAAE